MAFTIALLHPTSCGGMKMSRQDVAQDNEFHELSGPEGIAKIAELIKGIRICMLTTANPDGTIDSRPMATQDTKFAGSVWFLTRRSSEKVEEVQRNADVNLSYSDPGNAKYITLKGKAHLSDDKAKIKELWNPMYKAWFPQGENDPEITVMRVDISEGEYWEASASRLVRGARYLVAAVTGGKTSIGEAGHLDVTKTA
jgi:general stress protein 26